MIVSVAQERDKWKVAGMTSSEGEHVPFEKFMYIDGPVEVRSNLILMYIKSFQVRMFMS